MVRSRGQTADASGEGCAARAFAAWARLLRARRVWFTVAVAVVTAVLANGLARLRFDSSQETMVSPTSQVYADNLRYQESFGGELMVVVLDGDIVQLFAPRNRDALAAIEADIAASGRFHSILGPTTAIELADRQVAIAPRLTLEALSRDKAAASSQAERDALDAAFEARTASDARRIAAAGEQSLDNLRYVEFLLFDERGEVRTALRGAFPDGRHALFVARLEGNMSLDEQGVAVDDVERAVERHPLEGIGTLVTGTAALTSEVNERTRSEMVRSGVFAVLAMVVVLLLVFRARWRLLVLPVIAVAMVWAFGALGYLGIPLTMVTMSGLPILIGLGVDFAIQTHARYEQEAARAADDPLPAALAGVGPALLVALVAAGAGFLALRISPVPMVEDFAVMLALGTGVLLVAVLALVPVVLVWRDRRRSPRPVREGQPGVERLVVALTTSTHLRAPVVGALALVVTAAGFLVNPSIPVETDSEKLVAAGSPVLRDLRRLREVAGTSADAGFLVEADDVMRADVLAWMADYEQRQLERHRTTLVSSSSIASITAQVTGSVPTPGDARTVMAAAPPAIRDTFVDPRTGRAQILFAVGHLTLDEVDVLYDEMAADAASDAPAGVRVVPSGLALIGIETINAFQDGRTPMTLVALAAVLAWLVLSLRSLRMALIALLPVVTAVGASSLAVYALDLRVSLLAALSSPLAIAVCTEFSVLFIGRYREERRAALLSPDAAITAAATSIGRAFTVSGLTIAAGFGVVGLSGFPLLASFGAVVAVNVMAAMICALLVLPPILCAAAPHEQVGPEVLATRQRVVVFGRGWGTRRRPAITAQKRRRWRSRRSRMRARGLITLNRLARCQAAARRRTPGSDL